MYTIFIYLYRHSSTTLWPFQSLVLIFVWFLFFLVLSLFDLWSNHQQLSVLGCGFLGFWGPFCVSMWSGWFLLIFIFPGKFWIFVIIGWIEKWVLKGFEFSGKIGSGVCGIWLFRENQEQGLWVLLDCCDFLGLRIGDLSSLIYGQRLSWVWICHMV